MLAIPCQMGYVVCMDNYDSLDRLAHASGMTDLEYEAQQKEPVYQARLEKILEDVRNSDEPAEMPEVHRNHEERWHDAYEDFDYGYHDQYDF
jgi:hypothetical protein